MDKKFIKDMFLSLVLFIIVFNAFSLVTPVFTVFGVWSSWVTLIVIWFAFFYTWTWLTKRREA